MATIKKETPKQLLRSEKNRVLAGVCGGLADYFNFDATLIRIIFVLLTVFGGSGLILYIILWVLVPSKTTLGKNSDEVIKENVEELKMKSRDLAGRDPKAIIGIVLIVLGLSLLLENLGVYVFSFAWKLWPIIIVVIGLSILTKRD